MGLGSLCNFGTTAQDGRHPGLTVLASQQGMALLVTLLLLAAMVVLTLHLHKRTMAEHLAARALAEQQQLRVTALGVVRVGQVILAQPGGAGDSLLDPWARVSGDDLAQLFGEGVAELAIIDLSGRLQLNSLVDGDSTGGKRSQPSEKARQAREILFRLLSGGDFATSGEWEARQLVDALVDWLDADEQPSPGGAESGYYQGLVPPYGCRNGPARSIEELLLVRGMSRELLFGTGSTKALADHLTIYGSDGRINLNTAPLSLLRALHGNIDATLLGRLDAYRRDPSHHSQLGTIAWYKNIGGWPRDIVLYEDLLSTRSNYFQITATARQGVFAKTATVVTERVGGSPLRIRWQKIE